MFPAPMVSMFFPRRVSSLFIIRCTTAAVYTPGRSSFLNAGMNGSAPVAITR